MNPLKQKGCQACGAALPRATADVNDAGKAQARATLKGLRSPQSPTDGLTPAELEAIGGEMSARTIVVPRDGTMPSFVAPTTDVINKHRDSVTSTILGHGLPGPAGSTTPDSGGMPATPKDPPMSPRAQPTFHASNEVSRPAMPGRTLLGHTVPESTPPRSSTPPSPTSQTMPSMQAVAPDSVPSLSEAYRARFAANPERVSTPATESPQSPREQSSFLDIDEGPADSPAGVRFSPTTPRSGAPRSHKFRDDPGVTVVAAAPPSSQGQFGVVAPISNAAPVRTGSPESMRAANVRLGRRVLIIACALLLGLSLFAMLWTPPEPPIARLTGVGEQTLLELTCATCDDGSSVTIGDQKGTFTNHRASVPMTRPLNLGYNDIEIEIERTGFGRNERMHLQFPIDYRLAWDVSRLNQFPPLLAVTVEAALGVTVSLDGQPVSLADNKGVHSVAIASDLMGPSVTEQWLEKSVAVAIGGGRASTPPDHFTLKIPIVPLVVDTPWDGFLTSDDTTVVSGRSTPNTKVVVAGNPATTNAEGYFELALQTTTGLNTFTVSAEAEGHASRFVNVSLTKVPSLHKAALEYQGSAVNRFDEMTKQLQTPDATVRVALPGKVQQSKVQGSTTVSLVAINAGCPNRNCIVRVVYPTRVTLRENERVAVFGAATLTATGPTPQSMLPEVRAHLLLR